MKEYEYSSIWVYVLSLFHTNGSSVCILFFTCFFFFLPLNILGFIAWKYIGRPHSFLTAVQYSTLLPYHNFFNESRVGRHLDKFRSFGSVNSASLNILMYMSLCTCANVSVGGGFRNGVAGLKCLNNFNFDRLSQIAFQRDYTLPDLL